MVLVFALLAAWFGFDMIERTGAGRLWGHRPLGLFLGVAVAAIMALAPWLTRSSRKYRWLALSGLSALLLSAGFPDILFPFPGFMFVGLAPLLLIEREISAARPLTGGGSVFRYTYITLVLWNIGTTWWVGNTALIAGIFAIMANAFLQSLPFIAFHYTRRVLPRLGYLAFIAYWMCFEYIHLNWELTWPWLTLGNSLAEYPAWVQWYEYTGVFGGSLWILLANVLVLKVWLAHSKGTVNRSAIVQLSLVLFLPVVGSLFRFYTYQAPEGKTVEVVVVQPNFEPHYEKFMVPEAEQARRFVELSAREVRPETDYLVFPETSFGYLNTAQVRTYPAMRQVLDFLEDFPETVLVTGLSAYYVFGPDEEVSRAGRPRVSARGDTVYLEVLNAAAQIDPSDPRVQWYRKSKLVPGPEIFPYREWLWFLGPLVRRLEGTWEGVGIQPERSALRSSKGAIGPAICYESIFGEYYTGYVRHGAQAIFIMTNDGWWDHTAGHRQHLHFASLRAIETRRPIARSANTGVSAFVDQLGIIRKATAYGEEAVIRDDIQLNDAITFYVRWGDLLARLALFTTILLGLNAVVKGVIRRKKPEAEKVEAD